MGLCNDNAVFVGFSPAKQRDILRHIDSIHAELNTWIAYSGTELIHKNEIHKKLIELKQEIAAGNIIKSCNCPTEGDYE